MVITQSNKKHPKETQSKLQTTEGLVQSALCEYSHNADAIMDRLAGNAHRFELDGDTLRNKKLS